MTTDQLKAELKQQFLDSGVILTGTFVLKSGKTSSFYVDIKKASTNPKTLKLIARAMAPLVNGEDRLAGVALGAVPLAAALAMETMKPYIMVRKEKKEHGTTKLIEGDLEEGEEVLLVEDVATTGISMVSAINQIRNMGARVSRALVVVDREDGAAQLLKKSGVELVSLLKISEIL